MQSRFLSELDTNGGDDHHQILERTEDGNILNLKRDSERPLLRNQSGSEEMPETYEKPERLESGADDGGKKFATLKNKTHQQKENRAYRPGAGTYSLRGAVPDSEGSTNASGHAYYAGCEKTDSAANTVGGGKATPENLIK